jgi:hypothetical protein
VVVVLEGTARTGAFKAAATVGRQGGVAARMGHLGRRERGQVACCGGRAAGRHTGGPGAVGSAPAEGRRRERKEKGKEEKGKKEN